MPIVKKWKKDNMGHFIGSLDTEDQDNEDVLVITGKTSTNKGYQNPAWGNSLMIIEGTMDSGASNS
eukprot:6787391-Heterocapsa_arctica.AAC.1